jgi:hypothetical protein
MSTVRLRANADGTATFRFGNYVEHFDAANLGLLETYERCRYAAVAAGLSLTPERLEELMRAAKGLEEGGGQ